MNELIKIEQNEINARDLWKFIQSKREFATWVKDRLEYVEAVENVDFISFDKNVKRENGATIRKEYIITLDLAKKIVDAFKKVA
ncbi:antA/AntB antirepressor family protein [Campylobacter hyointestinalis]|uniref:Phage anti-repressor protein n=1 Tax=Campylobacter hyointestinalis subsp. hyointestinalis TaxID=91352 RepID=A0A9W5ANA8_CAMHY|nr:antA/AntB antirepressor family protein [Campylobacter hyointestinalis]CUU74027.1 Phage anti-repressor protein [Campylobacter hyointestinalis subsp. hyointestinalis]CUU81847.1 Phage anti-repressor protein [Campylobacter hyointestinalis subsp. hyointestinalis]